MFCHKEVLPEKVSFPLGIQEGLSREAHLSLLAKNGVFFTRLDPVHTRGAAGALTLQDCVNQPFLPRNGQCGPYLWG